MDITYEMINTTFNYYFDLNALKNILNSHSTSVKSIVDMFQNFSFTQNYYTSSLNAEWILTFHRVIL